MEIIDRRIEPLIQVIRWQNIRLRRTLKEMSQYDQYAGNDFYIIDPFFLVRTAVCSLITSSPSAVQYQHLRFPRRSYVSAALYLPHSDRY